MKSCAICGRRTRRKVCPPCRRTVALNRALIGVDLRDAIDILMEGLDSKEFSQGEFDEHARQVYGLMEDRCKILLN